MPVKPLFPKPALVSELPQWQENTPISPTYGDVYFNRTNGLAESRHTFLEGNHLPQRFQSAATFSVGELGFGTGLNFLMTWHAWAQHAGPRAHLSYIGFEKNLLPADAISRALSPWPELAPQLDPFLKLYTPQLPPGWHSLLFGNVTLMLAVGDARELLPGWWGLADAWYLDGFAPSRNPQMWDPALLRAVGRHTAPRGTVATYSVAGEVRQALQEAGFTVQKSAGYPPKREMLTGTFNLGSTSRITET